MNVEEINESVEYTSQKTGFSARLIEKDYYCSLILGYLYSQKILENKLIFKGGTLIAKAYADFFRLSEDLDFSVPNARKQNVLPENKQFYELIKIKIENDSTSLVDMNAMKKNNLLNQIEYELNSVLQEKVANSFDFHEAWDIVLKISQDIENIMT